MTRAAQHSAAHSRRTDDARHQEKAATSENNLDRALEMTFPASDPIAVGTPTSTEDLSDRAPASRSVGLAAQHWVQLCVLPWTIWTAMALAMLGWPVMQAQGSPRPISERNEDHLKS